MFLAQAMVWTGGFAYSQFGKEDLQNYFGRFFKSPTWDAVIFEFFLLVQVWRTCSFVGPTGEASATESPKLGGVDAWMVHLCRFHFPAFRSFRTESNRCDLKLLISYDFRSYRFTDFFFDRLCLCLNGCKLLLISYLRFAKSQAAPIARKKKGAALTKRVWVSQVGISLKKHSLKLTASWPLENRPGHTRKLVTSIPTSHFQVPSYVSFRGVVCFFLDVNPQWLSLVDVEVPPPSVKVTKLKKGERYRG